MYGRKIMQSICIGTALVGPLYSCMVVKGGPQVEFVEPHVTRESLKYFSELEKALRDGKHTLLILTDTERCGPCKSIKHLHLRIREEFVESDLSIVIMDRMLSPDPQRCKLMENLMLPVVPGYVMFSPEGNFVSMDVGVGSRPYETLLKFINNNIKK